MVSSFLMPNVFSAMLNKWCHYKLYLLTPQSYIGKIRPIGHIWTDSKGAWKNTVGIKTGFLSLRDDTNNDVGIMYVENRVALKISIDHFEDIYWDED